MLKKMKITVYSSIQNLDKFGLAEGDTETSEETSFCTYRSDGDIISVSYKTQTEGGEVNTSYRLCAGSLTVSRSGAINSLMIFCVGETHTSIYEIPPYKFDMAVTAKRLCSELNENGGEIDLLYEMNIGDADKLCRMKIKLSEASA